MAGFNPGDLIRRKDGREFSNGQPLARVIMKPGSARIPRGFGGGMVWVEGGTWIDQALVEAVPDPTLLEARVTREEVWAPYGGDPMGRDVPADPETSSTAAEVKFEPDYKRLYEQELKWRQKEEKRSAKANTENAALRKKIRKLDHEARTFKVLYERSPAKQYDNLAEAMRLIKDIANTPIDDWIALSGEPTTERK